MLRTGSLEDAATEKSELEELVKAAAQSRDEPALPDPLPVVERDRGPDHYRRHDGYSLEKRRPDGGMTRIPGILFPTNHQETSGLVMLGNIGHDAAKEARCVDSF
ncbi:hypothetical protein [Arthrobacter bambusae]|uniref:Uncharacterized protein n=1 Tax=Arthrobacter bambusae TaxID=1338426 RepID=A0AAW8DKH7_9MICC|nr:hypothetical protein [Arthrobacter bambusae]MDP9905538.1 hypothetical protein [Arthrobacter bambusae]MDQ0127380.1 hypothetical protein [Arthrobacter bambusae]MDQ0178722.1 hypothetical protein [Arthrobacter bambusae]